MHKSAIVAFVVLVLAGSSTVSAQNAGQAPSNARMAELGTAKPPIGYVQFCETHQGHCGPFERGSARVHMNEQIWQQLVEVNDHVNATVTATTDWELFGVEEWWTYPVEGRGDCEAYVLEKRRLLMEMGWPANALLITVVLDERGDGHAILTVTTSAGDFVLDNLNPDVRLWSNTGYGYLMRQSKHDPNQWVALHQNRAPQQLPVAGVDNR